MKTNHDSEAIEMQKRFNEQRSQERNERMSTPKHTKELRYEQSHYILEASGNKVTHQLILGNDYVIAEHRTLGKSPMTEANWTELVRRWNTHAELLEALKQALKALELPIYGLMRKDGELRAACIEKIKATITKSTQRAR